MVRASAWAGIRQGPQLSWGAALFDSLSLVGQPHLTLCEALERTLPRAPASMWALLKWPLGRDTAASPSPPIPHLYLPRTDQTTQTACQQPGPVFLLGLCPCLSPPPPLSHIAESVPASGLQLSRAPAPVTGHRRSLPIPAPAPAAPAHAPPVLGPLEPSSSRRAHVGPATWQQPP